MATGLGSLFPKLDDLPPPPRTVPLRLWCALLAGPVTLGGSAAFAFTMVFGLIFAPATDPIGTWRLDHRRELAQGWLERVEQTHFQEGGGEDEPGTPIYRWYYTFLLPDGTQCRGSSYTVGEQFHLAPPAAGSPAPRLPVTVEYDPENPGTSRIEGTRTSPYGPWVLFVVLFSVAGLAVAIAGLWTGWRRGRLLRDGEVVPATVTACQFGAGDDTTYLPVAEYKNRTAVLRARCGSHPFMIFARGFIGAWTILAATFLIAGTVFCVVALVVGLLRFPGPPREKALFVLAFGGFLFLWLVVGLFMVRSGWQGWRATGRGATEPNVAVAVRCAFEFRLPDGELVQAKAPGRPTEGPGPESPQPALYDPLRPRRALLLSGLWPAVRVGEAGGWETSAGADSLVRLLVTLLLLAGPFVAFAVLR
jgi:hypothetical protein